MTDPVILVDQLTKTYGRSAVVRGLSFHVDGGECFGLLGPNGAGKTTSINMIAGTLVPTDGRVLISGVSLVTNPRCAKINIGLVPQDFSLYPALSGKDNLLFFGRLYGLWGRALTKRVQYALETVRLGDQAGMVVSAYSNGMKRRLNLAAGLLHDPAVLILDEPTVGIDAHSRHTIISELEELVRSGKTVLYCTHHLSEAESLCSRVAIMDSGQIIALDTPRELVRQHGKGLIRVEFESLVNDRMLQGLQRLGTVRRMSVASDEFQIQSAEPNIVLKKVLSRAGECGNAIRSMQLLEPTLETVFLNLTGRSISD
jgi:ABC-2 type transport system ATP-binding protein